MNTAGHRVRTFTKKDLARRVARATGVAQSAATRSVDEVFAALRDVIMSANPDLRIEVRDFGVFEVKTTKSKPKARNPKSGEIIYVPARRKTHFKPSKLLKNFLSQPLDGREHSASPVSSQDA